jgi:hypothetical protein
MNQNHKEIKDWAAKRLLGLFNKATIAVDISHNIMLRPEHTQYVFGEKVAQRIIDRRNSLPGMRFSNLAQIEGVAGLGPVKIGEALDIMSVPAAEAFRSMMYKYVLRQSWTLEHHSICIEEEMKFLDLVQDSKLFFGFVADKAALISQDRYRVNNKVRVENALGKSPLEIYEEGDVSAHAFALWFYKITSDSWFSYEQVHRQTEAYLNFMPDFLERTELRMFHGFKNENLLTGPITTTGLPVTVNYCEQTISLWTVHVID